MRITNQMLSAASRKRRMSLQKTSRQRSTSVRGSSNDILSAKLQASSMRGARFFSKSAGIYKNMETSADSLRASAVKLWDSGKKSLFARAEQKKNTEEVTQEAENMVSAYNDALQAADSSGDAWSRFYSQQLQEAAADKKEALQAVGITQKKDGTLQINREVLKKADLETLKKAFGTESGFTNQIASVSSRMSANANARQQSLTSGYRADGSSFFNISDMGRYNFWG